MEKMKRVLALLLVFAMLMPNMTTIALAADTEEDSVEISTEPVVLAEEPEVTEVTEAATEAPTEPPTEATEAPVVETEPVVVETEPPVTEETMVSTAETVEGPAAEEVGMVTETVTVTSHQDAVAEQVQHPVTAESCVEVIPDFGEDFENDFLFATYVEDQFLDNIPAKFGTAGRKRLYSEAAKYVYTQLWLDHFGDRAFILNDDKPAIRLEEGIWYAYGTPWSGKHDISVNAKVPLAGICMIHHSEKNEIWPFSGPKAIFSLLEQTLRPTDPILRAKLMELLDKLMTMVPIWQMGCNMAPEAALVSYEAMSRGRKEEET